MGDVCRHAYRAVDRTALPPFVSEMAPHPVTGLPDRHMGPLVAAVDVTDLGRCRDDGEGDRTAVDPERVEEGRVR